MFHTHSLATGILAIRAIAIEAEVGTADFGLSCFRRRVYFWYDLPGSCLDLKVGN